MAGESAREAARRQREKAERLSRAAELWERGAAGEETTAKALDALPAADWTVLHDVRWPGRRFANVDHIVVGPPGVFVIDSKNWSGSVVVRDHVLRQNGRSRETAVAGAAEAALAVAQLSLEVPVSHVHAVLCFVRDEPLTGWARDVMVCSTANIVEMLLSRPVALVEDQRRRVAIDLDMSLRAATSDTSAGVPRTPVTAPAARPSPASRLPLSMHQPSRRKRPASRRPKSKAGDGIKAVIALSVAALLAFSPSARDGLGRGIASLLSPDEERTSEPVQRDHDSAKRRDKQQPASD